MSQKPVGGGSFVSYWDNIDVEKLGYRCAIVLLKMRFQRIFNTLPWNFARHPPKTMHKMRLNTPAVEENVVDSKASSTARELPLLVIEDEVSVQMLLQAALRRHGYEAVVASTGSEGLKMLEEQTFRGVISDLRTPGGVSGADVLDWIRNHRPQLLSRMLFMTGDAVGDETEELLRQTGVPCIEKPFRVLEFISAVNRVLEN